MASIDLSVHDVKIGGSTQHLNFVANDLSAPFRCQLLAIILRVSSPCS